MEFAASNDAERLYQQWSPSCTISQDRIDRPRSRRPFGHSLSGIDQPTNAAGGLIARRGLFDRRRRFGSFRLDGGQSICGGRRMRWPARGSKEDGYRDRDTTIADDGEQEARHVFLQVACTDALRKQSGRSKAQHLLPIRMELDV
jgi:hypothetical protein